MEEELESTIAFKSNLQEISAKTIREDKHFLASVKDPVGLKEMKKQFLDLTDTQDGIYHHASEHCSYAFKDDFPWGTVKIRAEKNNEIVVCRCINVECEYFQECRPDFDPAELDILEENDRLKSQMEKTVKNFQTSEKKKEPKKIKEQEGDSGALSFLYSGKNEEKPAQEEENSITTALSLEETDIRSEEKKTDITVTKPAAPPSFASFEDVEQEKIIQLDPNEKTIVNAGPGTGKTWTLVEKLKYMLTNYDVDPENILVLCFSRAAVDVIRTRLKEAADSGELPMTWYMVDVRTFDSFCTYMIAWVSENIPELLPEKYILEYQDYDSRIETATSIFKREKDMLSDYSHVIVDEVQDLVGSRAELVLAILDTLPETCGFTLLGDSCQAIYDYLQDEHPRILTSEGFYKELFHKFKSANYYTLTENHRQGDELGSLMVPYREAILSGNTEDMSQAASSLSLQIPKSDVNIKHFSVSDAAEYTKKGTVGILTRTNGQALQISAWLRNEGVDHVLQRRLEGGNLAAWISKVLFNASTEVLGKDEFIRIFDELYPSNVQDAGLYWNALTAAQRNQDRNYYEIEELLEGLLGNARDPLLFKEPQDNSSAKITVSSIHRAKGREFDTVFVMDDLFSDLMDSDDGNNLEHKVCYVALTRPKKKLEKIDLNTQYIYIMKDQSRRCFKSGGYSHKKYLSHFEVGFTEDLNNRSFALDENRQYRIRNEIKNGTRLKLLKLTEGTEGSGNSVIYKIVPEDNEKEILGYTSCEFSESMEYAIQRIYDNYGHIAYKYFPNRFAEIYATGLTTCISANGGNIEGARRFGSMYVWNGIAVQGFAQMEKDRY